MRDLVLTERFKKSFSKYIQKHPQNKNKIFDILDVMSENIYAPSFSTHKLSRDLLGLRVCSCGYDCRIIFTIETNKYSGNENIILIDIGKHDEVY